MKRFAAALAAALLAATLAPAPGRAAPDTNADTKVQPAVRQALAGGKRADVLVALTERADLSGAKALRSHAERTTHGYRRLSELAARSQRGVRDALVRRGIAHDPLWIVNAVRVRGADAALVTELAGRPEVRTIAAIRTIPLPAPRPSTATVSPAAGLEWNIERIGADRVWSQYNTRGEGIVVANIDSGVQYNHPALVQQYRGNRGGGVFEHTYHWFDPYGECGPTLGPCDLNGHGTHTMGTMVGGEGLGVAPGARWIAARGCRGSGCDIFTLILAAQWVIAPFDSAWQNPRPDLAPHVVNNSWGSPDSDPFYTEAVSRWVEVGIMPVFSAGNSGPDCGTVGSPADYPNAYAVGAFDRVNAIAPFSSRGATGAAETKPNIAAPGVDVLSAVPPNIYAPLSGTSMAAPHVAGAVALLWSVAPALIGDVATTRRLLDDSAIDVADASCGGTVDDNPVWGEGRLDVAAAAALAPQLPSGTLAGLVSSGGVPVAGAQVTVLGDNNSQRTTSTDAAGRYGTPVPIGTYRVSASAFGYGSTSVAGVVVTAGATTTADLVLPAVPRYRISGVIRDSGGVGAAGITVQVTGTPLPAARTDAGGAYRIDGVPPGDYTLAHGAGRCLQGGSFNLTVDGDETVDLAPQPLVDASGYHCHRVVAPYVGGTAVLPLTGDDASLQVTLPFAMPFYGGRYSTAWVATNGFLTFDRAATNAINRPVPNGSIPNAAVFALWDDLVVDAAASIRTATLGTAPDRRYVVEWRNVGFFGGTDRVTFALELAESGSVTVHYGDLVGGPAARGASASVGIENAAGNVGLEYNRDVDALTTGTAVGFRISGGIRGTVTKPDGSPAAGALVQARAGTAPALTAVTAADGTYLMQMPLGTYTVDVSLATFGLHRATVVLDRDGVVVVHNAQLEPNERTVSGVVRDDLGTPVEGATVRLWLMGGGGGYDATFASTGPDGRYTFARVPETTSTAVLTAKVPRCLRDGHEYVDGILGGDVTRDITVFAPPAVVDGADAYGYQCRITGAGTVTATAPLAVPATGPPAAVTLPFAFPFYGRTYPTAYVSVHGYLTFLPQSQQSDANEFIPSPLASSPNAAVHAFWDRLTVDTSAQIRTGSAGSAPHRQFAVRWDNVLITGTTVRVSFAAVLHENGTVVLHYLAVPDDPRARGSSASVGIENHDNTAGLEFLLSEQKLRTGGAVTFLPPATVTGQVTGGGGPVAGATVRLIRNESVTATATTAADGGYALRVPLGTYALEVTHEAHLTHRIDPLRLATPGTSPIPPIGLVPR